MELGDHNNKLDKLETDIYNRSFPETPSQERATLKPETPAVPLTDQWNHKDITFPEPKKSIPNSVFKKIFIGSLAFFLLALVITGFIFYRGLNVISSDNISMTFLGPASIVAGQELDFDVVIQNKNKIPLSDVKMYIDYPDGTKLSTNLTQDLIHGTESLGDIAQNMVNRKTIRAVLFGKEHESKQIKVTIEYGVKNNNATFRKEALYNVQISSVPLQMTIDSQSQVVSGSQIETTVTLTSNTNTILNNLLLKVDYPFGYTFLSSVPQPTYTSSLWLIKALKPGEKQTFVIKGTLEGQEKDQRALHFTVGAQKTNDEKTIGTIFLSDVKTLTVNRPPLQADLVINGKPSDINPTIPVGTSLIQIRLTNTTPNVINNAQINVILSGSALNPASVVADFGSYNQTTKTVIWNQNLYSQLAQLNPGDVAIVDFSLSTLTPDKIAALQNGSVIFSINSNGTVKTPSSANPQLITTNLIRTAKTQSMVTLVSHATYSTGPFTNTGPVPPRLNNKTTYTITWIVSNSINAVNNATIQATLPANVHWTGVINPSSENITWNSDQSTVVWQLGTLGAQSKKQASFQVEITPTANELGSTPVLANTITFKGIDTKTTKEISVSSPDLTTAISTDPQYANQPGIVQN